MAKNVLALAPEEFRERVFQEIRKALVEEAANKHRIRKAAQAAGTRDEIAKFKLKRATLSPETLAKRLGIGESSLRRRFLAPECAGMTIGRAIRNLRLERAAQLLERRLASTLVLDVANISGWRCSRSFAAAFKLRYGMCPSEYQGTQPLDERSKVISGGDEEKCRGQR